MAKKMNSPEKSLPNENASSGGGAGQAPDAQVQANNASTSTSNSAEPSQMPPASVSSSGDQSFGAAVWATDKRVTALYNTHDARNSWMYIAGTGWVKLTTASDSANQAMTIMAAHARVKNCRIDYAVDGGVTTEIYIW